MGIVCSLADDDYERKPQADGLLLVLHVLQVRNLETARPVFCKLTSNRTRKNSQYFNTQHGNVAEPLLESQICLDEDFTLEFWEHHWVRRCKHLGSVQLRLGNLWDLWFSQEDDGGMWWSLGGAGEVLISLRAVTDDRVYAEPTESLHQTYNDLREARAQIEWQQLEQEYGDVIAGLGQLSSEDQLALFSSGVPAKHRQACWLWASKRSAAQRGAKEGAGYYTELSSSCENRLDKDMWRQISKDLHRTRVNRINSSKALQHQLQHVLGAYAVHDPVVRYCQGMHFIGGFLLANGFDEESTFWLLGAIAGHMMPAYFVESMLGCFVDADVMTALIEQQMPQLGQHLADHRHWGPIETITGPGAVIAKWLSACFINYLPDNTVLRLLDVTLFEAAGRMQTATVGFWSCELLPSVVLALLQDKEAELLQCEANEGGEGALAMQDLLIAHAKQQHDPERLLRVAASIRRQLASHTMPQLLQEKLSDHLGTAYEKMKSDNGIPINSASSDALDEQVRGSMYQAFMDYAGNNALPEHRQLDKVQFIQFLHKQAPNLAKDTALAESIFQGCSNDGYFVGFNGVDDYRLKHRHLTGSSVLALSMRDNSSPRAHAQRIGLQRSISSFQSRAREAVLQALEDLGLDGLARSEGLSLVNAERTLTRISQIEPGCQFATI